MPDKHLPFFLPILATVVPGAKVNIPRLIEAVIIAGATAFLTMWGVQKQTAVQIENLEATMVRIETTEKDNTNELKQQVREVRSLVESHILRGK